MERIVRMIDVRRSQRDDPTEMRFGPPDPQVTFQKESTIFLKG